MTTPFLPQNAIQELAKLSTAVSGPQLYGDDRDRVIALLNQLLVSCGVGNGYYRGNPPEYYTFTVDNPFHRLKGIAYNQLPRIGVDRGELDKYLQQIPPGFDGIWTGAVKKNPDPIKLVPHPIQGFQQLIQRQKMQKTAVGSLSAVLKDYMSRLRAIESDILTTHNKYTKCRQIQKQLSHRLLRVLAMQTLIQRYGLMIDEKEEALQCKLENLNAQLNAPDRLKQHVSRIYETLRKDSGLLKQKLAQKRTNGGILETDMHEVKRCLASRQALLENLVESIKSSAETLNVIESVRTK